MPRQCVNNGEHSNLETMKATELIERLQDLVKDCPDAEVGVYRGSLVYDIEFVELKKNCCRSLNERIDCIVIHGKPL